MPPADLPLYPGNELEVFAHAENWKAYWHRQFRPWIRGAVGEIGAGIGANTCFLQCPEASRWVCVEPDPACFRGLADTRDQGLIRPDTQLVQGTLASLPEGDRFDTLIYIDVIEHIADDRAEVAAAAGRLLPGGTLLILVPAYQMLYSPFDRAIGHHRRYNLPMLRAIAPAGCRELLAGYYDSAGLLASLANRLLLRQDTPSLKQIRFWDRCLVPISRCLDTLTAHTFGRSVLVAWQKLP